MNGNASEAYIERWRGGIVVNCSRGDCPWYFRLGDDHSPTTLVELVSVVEKHEETEHG